jgi:hypothetical protein
MHGLNIPALRKYEQLDLFIILEALLSVVTLKDNFLLITILYSVLPSIVNYVLQVVNSWS